MHQVVVCNINLTRYAGSPQKTQHRSSHPTEKQTPTLSQEFCSGYLLLQIVRYPQNLFAKGSESVFQWIAWIGVGSSAETAGSRDPAYPVVCTYSSFQVYLLDKSNMYNTLYNGNPSIKIIVTSRAPYGCKQFGTFNFLKDYFNRSLIFKTFVLKSKFVVIVMKRERIPTLFCS